jgi:Spy/CpxP family protein refolding chaperone
MIRIFTSLRALPLVALASILALAACDTGPAGPEADFESEDFAVVLFGAAAGSMENSLGPQGPRAFDGRSIGLGRLPAELALTDAQKKAIVELRVAFRAANGESLDALRAILQRAKAAREAGKSVAEVRAILAEAQPVARGLRPAVEALHAATRAILTAEQRAWMEANRPPKGKK